MEQYQVILESQLGPREGSLRFRREPDGTVTGSLYLLLCRNPVQGRFDNGGVLRVEHPLQTVQCVRDCRSEFRFDRDTVTGSLYTGSSVMRWHGIRQ